MEQIKPTRMVLLQKKAQVKLAKQGVELLKNKKDALLKEFYNIVPQLVESRKNLGKIAQEASNTLQIAKAIDGVEVVLSAALAGKRKVDMNVELENVWGLRVPKIGGINFRRSLLDRGYRITGVSSRINEASDKFEEFLNLIIQNAKLELNLKRIGEEIKKTNRRVNALEQIQVPKLLIDIKFIKSTLEERERENVFRLKMLKK
jgi:V/A-type H+/Na+-transporting ATPase subunit D